MTRYSAIAFVLLAASAANAAEKKVERTFAVSPGGSLVVDADSASVHVSASDTNQVTVLMSMRGSEDDLAAAKLDAFQKDNSVNVMMRRGKEGWFTWRSWNGEGEIQVTVPRNYAINVKTSGGSVEVKDIVGTATLHSSGGDITAKNMNGNVEAGTSGGGVFFDTVRGDVDAETSGGDVRLMNIDGVIRGRTSGGNVKCSLVGINRGVSATTSGGDIELTLPRAATANIEATTSGGDISSDLPVASTSWKDGHIKGTINGGGEAIEARTSGGSISLHAVD